MFQSERIPTRLSGSGRTLPSKIVTMDMLCAQNGSDPARALELFGFAERRYCGEGEYTSTLAAAAGRQALARSGLDASDIDLLVVATSTPDRKLPSTAAVVHGALGLRDVPAFDLNAACAGFIYMLKMADDLMQSGGYHHILLIGSDTFSTITNFQHPNSIFFGDGAGAAIVSRANDSRDSGALVDVAWHCGGQDRYGVTVPAGGSEQVLDAAALARFEGKLQMDGRSVARNAEIYFPGIIKEIVSRNKLQLGDIDLFVLHQASKRLLDTVQSSLGVGDDRVPRNLERFSNTVAATVPILYDELVEQGRIVPGRYYVLAGFGAGWTWGAALMRG